MQVLSKPQRTQSAAPGLWRQPCDRPAEPAGFQAFAGCSRIHSICLRIIAGFEGGVAAEDLVPASSRRLRRPVSWPPRFAELSAPCTSDRVPANFNMRNYGNTAIRKRRVHSSTRRGSIRRLLRTRRDALVLWSKQVPDAPRRRETRCSTFQPNKLSLTSALKTERALLARRRRRMCGRLPYLSPGSQR